MLILLSDIEAYKLISNIENNYEDDIGYRLLNKFNLDLLKLKKLLNLIILVYQEIFIIDSLNVNIKLEKMQVLLKQLENVALFLFSLGFFKEYILVSNFLYDFKCLKPLDNVLKNNSNILKKLNIFENLIELINIIIK